MGINIDVSFQPPLELVLGDLQAISGRLRSFREPLQRAVREVLSPSFQTNFSVGGRPSWEPLDQDTMVRNRRSGQPLVKTGRLQRVAGQMNIWSFSTEEAWISDLPGAEYGVFHQLGAGVPERPWAVMQPEDEAAIEEVFAQWIDELLDRYGWD